MMSMHSPSMTCLVRAEIELQALPNVKELGRGAGCGPDNLCAFDLVSKQTSESAPKISCIKCRNRAIVPV
jgi:hypothetical protein